MPRETNSNFGFNLPRWDRLFGTVRAEAHKFSNPQPLLERGDRNE
jgi:sterol desaturase/sphingolipid hydroxylase (fatty acid hydroxylase superfamily)